MGPDETDLVAAEELKAKANSAFKGTALAC